MNKNADPRAAWNAVAQLAHAAGFFNRGEAKQSRRLARDLANVLRLPAVRAALASAAEATCSLDGLHAAEEAAERAFSEGAPHEHVIGRGRWEKATERITFIDDDHFHIRHWRRNAARGRAWWIDVQRNVDKNLLYKAGSYEEGTPPDTLSWEHCDPEEELSMPRVEP